ncbi:MAG: neuraminidase-like domain-containing protein [Bacteroidota bacterium]
MAIINISGTVKHSNGNAIASLLIRINQKMIRSQTALGDARTDANGAYFINVTIPDPTTAVGIVTTAAAIFVTALDDKLTVLASSDIIYSPGPKISVNLTVTDIRYKGTTVFQKNTTVLQNYLAALDKTAANQPLTVQDVQFMSNQTGKQDTEVWHWVRAHQLEQQTRIPAEVIYGLFGQGLPTNQDVLLRTSPAQLKTTLANAAASSNISDDTVAKADGIVQQWKNYLAGYALTTKPALMDATLGDAFSLAVPDKNMQQQILSSYLDENGTIESFWASLARPGADPGIADRLQRALQFSALTANQLQLTSALMKGNANASAANGYTLQQVAEWDEADWTSFIKTNSVTGKLAIPTFIQGNSDADRMASYAATLHATLADAFPTQSFFGKIKKESTDSVFSGTKKDLLAFYANNPSFDISTTPTITLASAQSNFNFSGVTNKNKLLTELQSIQRLSALTPDFASMKLLKSQGLDAAFSIMSFTQSQFVESYSTSLGSAQNAFNIYQQAEKTYMVSLALYGRLHNGLNFGTTTTPSAAAVADPTLRTMFGSLDACDCEECTSVFSAAAYYADILNFLYKRMPDGYQELIRRRPDLPFIELNCDNTNTPLPYVDLVTELLENFILNHKTPPVVVTGAYQTTWQAAELAANPEHINYAAYDELKKAVFPQILPFNFPVEEARIYLTHLGVPRHQLMTIFFAGNEEAAFNDFDISMERLQLSPQEAKVLTGEITGNTNQSNTVCNFYGFDKETGYKPLSDPLDSSKQITGVVWSNALAGRIDFFLQQTSLSYKDMLALLLCDFINPILSGSRKITIVTKPTDTAGNPVPPDTCALDLLQLQGMDETDLKKIHRFLRLRKKLDWTMYELDLATKTFFISDFNNDGTRKNYDAYFTKDDLRKISQADFLKNQLHVPVANVLALWSAVDTTLTYTDWQKDNYPFIPSLYEKLFRNKAVINPADVAFTADAQALTGNMDDHAAAIFAALQISDNDYEYLKTANAVTSNNLNLVNLSSLYRHALLAKKLKLSVKDFLSIKAMTGIDPFADPLSTFRYISKCLMVKASGFSTDQVQYLIHHVYLAQTTVAPDDVSVSVFLSELRAALRGIETAGPAEQRNTIAQKFSENLKITTTAAQLLLHSYVKSTADAGKAIEEDFRADDFDSIDFLKTYPDPADNTKETEPLFERTTDANNLLQIAVPVLFDDYMRLGKIAIFINKLKLSDTEIENILKNVTLTGCTDLAALPVTPASGNFTAFEKLIVLIQSRDLLPVGLPVYFDIVNHAIQTADGASDPDKQIAKNLWLTDIVTRTNWDRGNLEMLAGNAATLSSGGILKTNFPPDFRNGDLLLHISQGLKVLNKIGLHAEWITAAIANDFDGTTSQAVKNAAKSKYDETQWLSLAKPLRDDLREKQRAALAAFVVAGPDSTKHERWKDTNELYEYLLIDVEMKPINMTSRIKQAICSLQLFIDRVLMNLEHPNSNPLQPVLKLGGEEADEWKQWRQIYRIWEANRKIFLYPENWLEPELRDDKSPFFKDLEAQLLQNELTDGNVQDAFYNYLEKLDGVARLEVVGLYHQTESATPDDKAIDTLHVFARSYPNPHKYFHRTLEESEWKAWDKMDIDIDGNLMVPVIFNRRLCVFWLFLTPKSEQNDSLDPNSTVNAPLKFYKIQVAWTEFKNNRWTAKRLSKQYIETDHLELTDLQWRQWVTEPLAIHTSIQSDGKLRLQVRGYYGWSFARDEKDYSGAAFLFTDINNEPSIDFFTGPVSALNNLDKTYPYINPKNTTLNEMMLQENDSEKVLYYDKSYHYTTNERTWDAGDSVKILTNTGEGKFRLVTSAYYTGNPLSEQFFFQDAKNTFYAEHKKVPIRNFWKIKENISIGSWTRAIAETYPGIYPAPPEPINPLNDPEYYFSRAKQDQNALVKSSFVSQGRKVVVTNNNLHILRDADVNQQAAAQVARENALASNIIFTKSAAQYDYLNSSLGYTMAAYHMEDRFTFSTFYHAHVKTFIKALNRDGVKGLLKRSVEIQPDTINFGSASVYAPLLVTTPYPTSEVDFAFGGAYAQYNWELFFHVPMTIACRLSTDQRFEEARDWFHYIFDPTQSTGGDKERFWQFLPFWKEAQNKIETLDDLLRNEAELSVQIDKWMENPFQPHVIARMRISAYMRNVVMKYIDNLIAWGDQLFRRDTIEAINEATNLYILAANILGEKPQQIPPRASHADYTFDEIKDKLDDFSNALVDIETFIAPSGPAASGTNNGSGAALGKMFYFCVPRNDYILSYWDTVADRLFKIRNSMNIEGVVRTLPLFEPPIDPGMLVRAAAAGMDLSSILSDLNAGQPAYRFSFMLQKANELCNEVKSLGSALLQALEKRDAEAMSLLRSAHEQNLLKAVLTMKERAVDDANTSLESVKISQAIIQAKYDYYQSRTFMNANEQSHLNMLQIGMVMSMVQGELEAIGSSLAVVPNVKIGAPTSAGATFGGENLGQMMRAISQQLGIAAAANNTTGQMASALGSYNRRMDEWTFQAATAKKEIDQAEKQALSAEIKLAMAAKDVGNHKLRMDNAAEEEGFMRSKFTNQQLYEWMIGQLATVYFQSYQLVFDLAKKAERCYQYELGLYNQTSFIQFGYWDSLKKGLLSAEKMQYDLRRMETAYYDANKRELELSKNISVVFTNPQALLDLRQTGTCTFSIPEALFDLDFQGHYFRRIKSVAISIPCIAGPYTTISGMLRLQSHTLRLTTSTSPAYQSDDYGADLRFRHITSPVAPIGTSTAQNDAGVFEMNFRDERYLPFEGCGAISTWSFSLNEDPDFRMFDYDTISDVIINIKYTAREDAGSFRNDVSTYLKGLLANTAAPLAGNGLLLWRMFSLKQEFSTEWFNMLHPASGAQQSVFLIDNNRFPYFAQTRNIQVKTLHVYGILNTADDYTITVTAASGTGTKQTLLLTTGDQYHDSKDVSAVTFDPGQYTISITRSGSATVADTDMKDLMVVFEYQFQ